MNKIFLFLLPAISLAQEAVPVTQPNWVDNLSAKIPTSGPVLTVMVFLVGGFLDFLVRVKKTQKPLDLMIVASKVLASLSGLCLKLSNLIDKFLPQRSEEKKEDAPANPTNS